MKKLLTSLSLLICFFAALPAYAVQDVCMSGSYWAKVLPAGLHPGPTGATVSDQNGVKWQYDIETASRDNVRFDWVASNNSKGNQVFCIYAVANGTGYNYIRMISNQLTSKAPTWAASQQFGCLNGNPKQCPFEFKK